MGTDLPRAHSKEEAELGLKPRTLAHKCWLHVAHMCN